MRQCSFEVQKNAMTFLNEYFTIKDNAMLKGALWNAFKKFESIPASEFPSSNPNLIDSITQSPRRSPNDWYNSNSIVVFRIQ